MKKVKTILAVSLGSALEFYNLMLYSLFAPILVKQFFPHVGTFYQEDIIVMIFFLSYLARPLGGLFFGYIGDIKGRVTSLYYSMSTIAITTIIFAVLPNYNKIGAWASIAFITIRVIQGFAIGGNLIGSYIYMYETNVHKNKIFWISAVNIGLMRGIILAVSVSTILFIHLIPSQLESWGWRFAFIVGLPLMVIISSVKRNLVETPYYKNLKNENLISSNPIYELFSRNRLLMLKGIGLTVLPSTIGFILFSYLPTLLKSYGANTANSGYVSIVTISMFSIILPVFGWWIQHINPIKIILSSCLIVSILIFPLLHLMTYHGVYSIYIGLILLIVSVTPLTVFFVPTLISIFHTNTRYTGVSFAYNLSIALFAGLAPLLLKVAHYDHYSLISALTFLVIISSIITAISTLFISSYIVKNAKLL